MATVARRTIRSSPQRDTLTTWSVIVDLLTTSNTEVRPELESVAGIASSIIAEKACESSPILVSCEGPQTRFYCIYDDDAIDGSDANEDSLGFDPLNGDWSISLPCTKEDLTWVQSALKDKSERITARDMTEKKQTEENSTKSDAGLELNVEGFLRS